MTNADELWNLEERFWTGGGDSARGLAAKGAVFVFPYPAGILPGGAIWESLARTPRWRSIVMSDKVITRHGDTAILAYRSSAEREGVPIYEALCASTYLCDEDAWVLMAHQQSPVTIRPATSI
jgi:hypothetical protein